MIISKELYLQRPLPSGNFPIVIRVSHLGKDKIIDTYVCCHRRHWDMARKSVSHRDAAYSMKNNHIESVYRRIAGNIQNYLDKILEENLEALINNIYEGKESNCNNYGKNYEGNNDKMKETNNKVNTEPAISCSSFSKLIQEKISSTSSLNTRRGYETFLRYFSSNFDSDPSPETLNQEFVENFRRKLEETYPAQGSMRHLMASRLNAIVNFGKTKGVIPQNFSCKLPSYPLFPSERNLSEKELKRIYKLFQLKILEDPSLKEYSTLSLALFILDIAFQGLAPTDLAALKVKDLFFSKVSPSSSKLLEDSNNENEIEVVTIKTLRKKTGQPVHIVAPIKHVRQILNSLLRNKSKDDYLIPCFSKEKTYSLEQRQDRLANFFHKLSISLNEVLKCNDSSPFSGKVTFYFARHAFCNLVDSMDIPRHLIQHLIGHRVTVLERSYLRRITSAEQAAISLRIFSNLSSEP